MHNFCDYKWHSSQKYSLSNIKLTYSNFTSAKNTPFS